MSSSTEELVFTYTGDRPGEEVRHKVTRVIVDASVTTIGEWAFQDCSSLLEIEIPSSVITIGEGAFQDCSSLTAIEIPSSVTAIGEWTFQDCSSLSEIEIPSSVATIGRLAFQDCSSLSAIVIPSSVTTIGEWAFQDCSSLSAIVIPSSVTTIGEGAFQDCSSLILIEIPSSVTAIGERPFQDCSSLVAAAKKNCNSSPEKAVNDWLKIRFDNFPLHRVCHKANVTKEEILACCKDFPDALKGIDNANLTALHVLMSNPRVNLEMVEVLLEKYPEATRQTDINGWNALHHACYNPHTTVGIVKSVLSDIHRSLEILLLSATDTSLNFLCAVTIRQKRLQDIQLALFELYPINMAQLNSTKADDQKRLVALTNEYLKNIFTAPTKMLNLARQHGWVHLVGEFEEEGEAVCTCLKLIETTPIEDVEYLAYCKDNHNRSAMDNATSKIRAALEKKILFLGRFELVKGPPIHLSDTSVVLQAIDRQAVNKYGVQFDEVLKEQCHATSIDKDSLRKGLSRLGFETGEERFDSYFVQLDANQDGRVSRDEFAGICKTIISNDRQGRVVLKFMKNKEQFQREVDSRGNHRLGHNYVVHITGSYNSEDPQCDFAIALKSKRHAHDEDLSEYKYAIVMPCADRNLDTIFRSERPDDIKIRSIAKDIADAIAHLHKNGMIHGDVKLLNAVQVGTRFQLIDLDASAPIGEGSFAGAKFSSGMLPPEMIAKLTIEEYDTYMAYFRTNVSANRQEKIQPKGVGSNTIFAVKTFLTKESTKRQFGKDNKPESIIYQEPVEGLPYHLVGATAAIDIWSFGALLYELYTGAPLFAVNRDDDLKDGASMKELYEWNDEKKMKKLRKITDPSAHSLLKNILSKDLSERYDTMNKVLEDGYFTTPNAAEAIDLLAQKITMEMKINTKMLLEKIDSSASVTCKAIFDATEVNSPACFIILPEELPEEIAVLDSETGDEDHWVARFEYINQVLDKASSCITAPLDFGLESIKTQFIEKEMFLYLVDEYTGKAVVTKGAYPIKIDVRTDKVKKFLPVMAVGMKAMAVGNTAVGLAALFHPGVPPGIIPKKLMDKMQNFIEDTSTPEVIKQASAGTNTSVRGNALREFSAFLKEEDVKSTFSGMRRLCDTLSGNAIWVTEGSAKKIELKNDSSTTETAEVKRLKADIKRLKTELAKSSAEEVKQLKADIEGLVTQLARSKCGCCVLM